jgi:hypothetical protein
MSRIEMPGYCYCECHEPGVRVMHCVPCCAGECPTCKRYVTDERHFDECRKRFEELVKEAQEHLGGC